MKYPMLFMSRTQDWFYMLPNIFCYKEKISGEGKVFLYNKDRGTHNFFYKHYFQFHLDTFHLMKYGQTPHDKFEDKNKSELDLAIWGRKFCEEIIVECVRGKKRRVNIIQTPYLSTRNFLRFIENTTNEN